MAKRGRKGSMLRWPIALLVMAAIATALWFGYRHLNRQIQESERAKILKTVAADKINPINDGLHVRVSGMLSASGPARDAQLGVSAAAAVLLRNVEMFEWREHCVATVCNYDTGWGAPLDSRKFRDRKGHENPPVPFANAEFPAPGLKLGAFGVDAALLVAQHAPRAHPVTDAVLPPNLAASFNAQNGALYAGGAPAHPQVGMLRVSYRSVALGAATLEGVQRGSTLSAK